MKVEIYVEMKVIGTSAVGWNLILQLNFGI